MANRRKIRKVVISPRDGSITKRPRPIIKPIQGRSTTKPRPTLTAANPEIRKTQIMHEMFLNNILDM